MFTGTPNDDALQLRQIQYPEIDISGLILRNELIVSIGRAIENGDTFCIFDPDNRSFSIHIARQYTVVSDFPNVAVIKHEGFKQFLDALKISLIGNRTLVSASELLLHPIINPFLAKHLPEIDKQIKALM